MARRYQAVSIGTFQRRSAPSIISNSNSWFLPWHQVLHIRWRCLDRLYCNKRPFIYFI